MTRKAGVKAGLIGVAVMLVLTLLNQVLPLSGGLVYVMCGVSTLAYVGIGILAGVFLAPPRSASNGARAGVIAGLISGVINSVIGYVILTIRLARGLGMPGVDPAQLQLLTEAGYNLQVFAIPGMVCGFAIGAVAAAIGGAVLAAIKPD